MSVWRNVSIFLLHSCYLDVSMSWTVKKCLTFKVRLWMMSKTYGPIFRAVNLNLGKFLFPLFQIQLYFFYYLTKLNSTTGHFLSKTAEIHTWTLLLLVRKTVSEINFCKWNSICSSKMDLHLLSEWSDQVLNLVLFDSRKNRTVLALLKLCFSIHCL